MSFFETPILNSPYEMPRWHWELNKDGHPTDRKIASRRRSDLISAMPKSKSSKGGMQETLGLGPQGLEDQDLDYNVTEFVNEIRREVEVWRNLRNPSQWQVTPTTQRLLQHWRGLQADGSQPIRPFFCQLEAVETAIWLAEVAPKETKRGKRFRARLQKANSEANPDLFRIAMKLATGAGKTTVMAMLIAWQTLNAVRSPNSRSFGLGFLIVTPGITIRDRLRVLLPNDADSYYRTRNLVPSDLLQDMQRAKIVLTNYHAFKLRERLQLAKGTRDALSGHGDGPITLESEGQMLQRVMPELMGTGSITVINDEAHHCYRERATDDDGPKLTGDDRKEAEENREAARLWISGLEAAKRKLGVRTVYDLSATPFFLSGSGWHEGTLFPWVVSDFSLMDAIECGIVKLPRVPIADNLPGQPQPLYRNLWKAIGKKMPKKAKGARPDPDKLPLELKTAIDALYGHYKQTFELWQAEKVGIPPVFIIVCNNTTNSELLRDYVAGWERENEDGTIGTVPGKCELFSNFASDGERLSRPRTVLIDSASLEAGGDIDKSFRDAHAEEIEAFRREQAERSGGIDALTDADILREVMNTVGRKGRLGEQVRCVVSVSMLTEGWDANNVTHILGLRAFGTQLICEQVIGRALRRLSYDVDDDGLFRTEYADIMGIDGLNFSDGPRVAPPQKPRDVVSVRAVSPERDHLEITFPRVQGYVADLPADRIEADFTGTEPYVLTPDKVGAAEVTMQGIVGEGVLLTLDYLKAQRRSTIAAHIAKHMIFEKLRDANERPRMHLFPAAKRIVHQWLSEDRLVCKGGTMEAQLLYRQLADEVCDIVLGALIDKPRGNSILRAVLDPYTPTGSTMDVNFTTTKATRYQPRPDRSHVNWIITDSDWEDKLAAKIEQHPRVLSYAKNHNLGLEVPYLREGEGHMYLPDFLIRLDAPEPTTLIVEVKGFRGHDAMLKTQTIRDKWIPGVNRLGKYGRWSFAELRDVYDFGPQLDAAITEILGKTAA